MDNGDRDFQSEAISAFLVDRNGFFRQGVRAALSKHKDIKIVGESDGGEAGFALIESTLPRVALIDVNPPLLSGIELARRITQRLPGISIVMLTPYHNDDEFVQAIIAGAVAYSRKDVDASELATIIRRVASDEMLIIERLLAKPYLLERVVKRFQSLALSGRAIDSHNAPITERETEILSYVACGYGNKQIAHALRISEQTIKNHMTSIMNKLDASDRTHAVVMAMQHGWITTSETRQHDKDAMTG